MPTLHWVGKDKVVNHHRDVPYRVLNKAYSFASQPANYTNSIDNRIIHGDNLEALKSLLPEFEGKINCIYIDPPYNTGEEKWKYNDNVNDPKFKKWFEKTVGKEGEDLSRHDKWLCMMYPRLKLLHRLLADEGIIIIHIDENVYSFLHLILIEIFGSNNDLGSIIWDKKNPKGDATKISYQHESILVFSKNHLKVKDRLVKKKKNAEEILKKAKQLFSKIGKKEAQEDLMQAVKKYKLSKLILDQHSSVIDLDFVNTAFKSWIKKQSFSGGEAAYNSIDKNGDVFQSVSMAWPNKQQAPDEYFTPLVHPFTNKNCPVPERGWRYPPSTMADLIANNEIIFGSDESTQPRNKYLLKNNLHENIPSIISFAGSDDKFQKEVGVSFENPKPHVFVSELLSHFSQNDDLILDSFAGSGTTAHAVLKLNSDNPIASNRKFILIETLYYAETITAERVRRVMNGYGEGNKAVAGLGGIFDFYTVGERLLHEDGMLNPAVGLPAIRDYVAWTEGVPIGQCAPITPIATKGNASSPSWLGEVHGLGLFFVWEDATTTTLDLALLHQLVKKKGRYLIYADQCALGEDFMRRHGITFKKIPRDITRL